MANYENKQHTDLNALIHEIKNNPDMSVEHLQDLAVNLRFVSWGKGVNTTEESKIFFAALVELNKFLARETQRAAKYTLTTTMAVEKYIASTKRGVNAQSTERVFYFNFDEALNNVYVGATTCVNRTKRFRDHVQYASSFSGDTMSRSFEAATHKKISQTKLTYVDISEWRIKKDFSGLVDNIDCFENVLTLAMFFTNSFDFVTGGSYAKAGVSAPGKR